MRVLVTGCAGFIGSNVVDHLVELEIDVHGTDNLVTGNKGFIGPYLSKPNFSFFELDLFKDDLSILELEYDFIFHLSANADIRGGINDSIIDLEQNIIVTHKILEFARRKKKKPVIIFASSAAAIGEPNIFPTPEDIPIPKQTSMYGASKMSCEAIISAYANVFGIESYAFRFVSILGPRYTHGHVFDFVRKLCQNPHILNVLGDGGAKKSYLHVYDCVNAILMVGMKKRPAKNMEIPFEVFNLGLNETIKVADSAKLISNHLKLKPKFIFENQKRGWVGDNPFVHLSTKKIEGLGWVPKFNIKESILQTVDWLIDNPSVFEQRQKTDKKRNKS